MPITEFTALRIVEMNIGLIGTDGTYGGLTNEGCINDIEVEPEIRTITKTCEGVEVLSRPQIDYLTLSINAHFKPGIIRKMDGLKNDGLAVGVYGYPKFPIGAKLLITAKVLDENQVVKYIAFPNVMAPNGLSFSIDNTEDEVQLQEKELRAYNDVNDMSYYEAFADELEDDDIKTKWMNQFTPELVKDLEA